MYNTEIYVWNLKPNRCVHLSQQEEVLYNFTEDGRNDFLKRSLWQQDWRPVVIAALWISLLILIYSICYFIYIIKLTQDYILFFRITMKILYRVWSTGIKTHLIWVDGVLGVILGHLDSTLNPLEMLFPISETRKKDGTHLTTQKSATTQLSSS